MEPLLNIFVDSFDPIQYIFEARKEVKNESYYYDVEKHSNDHFSLCMRSHLWSSAHCI